MKLLLYGLLACWIGVASDAHATNASGSQARYSKGSVAHNTTASSTNRAARANPASSGVSTKKNDKPLVFDKPAEGSQATSPTIETISSLANGSSPVNPWFPERGAIGVRVQVAW